MKSILKSTNTAKRIAIGQYRTVLTVVLLSFLMMLSIRPLFAQQPDGQQWNPFQFGDITPCSSPLGDNYSPSYPTAEMWTTFTVSSTTELNISVCDSDTPTAVTLYDEYNNVIEYSDQSWCGDYGEITTVLQPGRYYIGTVFTTGQGSSHQLRVTPINSNNYFYPQGSWGGTAVHIYGNTFTHTLNNDAPCFGNGYGTISPDVHYSFTLTESTLITVDNCGSDIPTNVYILAMGHVYASSVHTPGLGCESGRISITLDPGHYGVVAEGYEGARGNITTNFQKWSGNTVPVPLETPSTDHNYILSYSPREPIYTREAFVTSNIEQLQRDIVYYDGLGRPVQSVGIMASPTYKDIVQHMEYDSYGREPKKYLPYAEQTADNGAYKTAAKTNQAAYYSSGTGWDPHVAKTANPYAQTVFENSPMDRPLEQGAPGAIWQPYAASIPNSGHTVRMQYGANGDNEVPLWNVVTTPAIGAAQDGYYVAAKLYKNIIRDENWVNTSTDPDNPSKTGTIEEFRDFQERVVLKRVWKSETEKLDTHYVYDIYGNLRYVIPPGYTTATVTDNNADFNELLYAYRYDTKGRLTEKKIPGKGWEYMIYNKLDQVILSQDASQRAVKKWSYSKYDAFGRITSTGIYTNTTANQSTRVQVQTLADAVTPQWESRLGTTNYTNTAFPSTVSQLQELTVSYYDDYTFAGASTGTLQPSGITRTLQTKTLLTGMKVSRDDGTAPLLTVNYYDDRAQLIQSVSQNHLNGTDRVTNEYTFVGELTKSTRVHIAKGVTTTMVTTNSYDHVGRLLASKHYINDPLKEVTLANHEYNEIGQLKKKSVGGNKDGANYHTAVDYAYNERGWTTGAASPQFTYRLNYDRNSAGTTLSNAQYNGNIAQQLWGHGPTTNSTFAYSYDKLNRLTNGTSTGTTVMIEALTYDDMGNIKTLARNTGNTTSTTSTTYTYNNSNKSNRLASLTGAVSGTYTYDTNGNATKDRTGMTIRYNHLNLPDSVYNASVRVGYLYDAMGTKLRKYSNQGGNRDYVGGIEYNGTNIELIHMGEGVAYRNTSNNTYTYRYNLTDHLGNVRSTVYRNPTTNAVEVLQRDDYYPFGKQRVVAAGNNKYLYNGKEIQGELGGQYDYGARFYDAEIGRFNVIDRFAEKYYPLSQYQYAGLDPVKNIDVNGDSIWYTIDKNVITLNVTAKVINQSSSNINVGRAAGDIASGIDDSFSGSLKLNGKTYELKTNVKIDAAESMDEVSSSDHLFVMANSDGKNARGATSMIGGKVVTLAESDFADDNWMSNNFSYNNTRTAVHEFGHAAGLDHESASGSFLNLMKQRGKGSNITGYQRSLMLQNKDKINLGSNSLQGKPYPYLHMRKGNVVTTGHINDVGLRYK